jgi:riboflavin biosynthesis pyrimidine reductase
VSVEARAGTSVESVAPAGPGAPFELLFDGAVDPGPDLPASFRDVYPGSWRLPPPAPRPYVYVNFVLSRDGRVSFNEPGHMSGVDVAGFDGHDRWLMGLLRARADAILMGDNTLRIEPDHVWTAEFIHPGDAAAFTSLRAAEGRAPRPLQVFLSLEGDVDVEAARIFSVEGAHVVLATTRRGAARARTAPRTAARVDILELGVETVDVRALLSTLRSDYGVESVLCEGGPRAYASLLAAGCVDDEFLTLSPVVVGSSPELPRPGLVESVGFPATASPRSRPLSLHRAGDMLFLRSRLAFPA